MRAALRRIGAFAVASALVWSPAHAQLLPHSGLVGGGSPVGGVPGLGLPSPSALPAPAARSSPTTPASSAASTAKAQASAQAIAARLPPIGAMDPVATLDISTNVKPRALSVSRDVQGVISLKAAETTPAVSLVADGYRRRAEALLAQHPDAVEPDAVGQPVARREILGLNLSDQALRRAQAAGFALRERQDAPDLGLAVAVLVPPRGVTAREALLRLRALDPASHYDLDHIYFESGATGGSAAGAKLAAAPSLAPGVRIGLVDGAAPAGIPPLKAAHLVQQAFAPGGLRPTAHSAAVASLLVGQAPGFRGAAPGATLYVADVYGAGPVGGSALAVVRALGWLAQARVPVINISLVGPPNAVLAAGVAALLAKGHLLVAAVGNDGPAAPPLYPAAYPGVVAVTGVDARRQVLPEAGRGPHVAFAAPGAGMLAAGLDGGLAEVRGTSFAAPLVAGRLAALLPAADPARAAEAVEALGRQAVDLGVRGRDPVYGRGLVAFELAQRPGAARYASP